MSFERFSVVVVPFPFADRASARRRPAVVVSHAESLGSRVGHSVMAMITSAGNPPWPYDVQIVDIEAAGLPQPSVARMKLFTLDDRLVVRVAGRLAAGDAAHVQQALDTVLGGAPGPAAGRASSPVPGPDSQPALGAGSPPGAAPVAAHSPE